jgi:hypothetical protein
VNNNDDICIPIEFIKTLSIEEFDHMMAYSEIRGETVKRLWLMTDRKGEPPEYLEIVVRRKGPRQ